MKKMLKKKVLKKVPPEEREFLEGLKVGIALMQRTNAFSSAEKKAKMKEEIKERQAQVLIVEEAAKQFIESNPKLKSLRKNEARKRIIDFLNKEHPGFEAKMIIIKRLRKAGLIQ